MVVAVLNSSAFPPLAHSPGSEGLTTSPRHLALCCFKLFSRLMRTSLKVVETDKGKPRTCHDTMELVQGSHGDSCEAGNNNLFCFQVNDSSWKCRCVIRPLLGSCFSFSCTFGFSSRLFHINCEIFQEITKCIERRKPGCEVRTPCLGHKVTNSAPLSSPSLLNTATESAPSPQT